MEYSFFFFIFWKHMFPKSLSHGILFCFFFFLTFLITNTQGVNGIGVNIQVGMLVIRGPDWRYGRQDGGDLNGKGLGKKQLFGKVVELRPWITKFNGTDGTTTGDPITVPGSVRIQWLETKQVNVYRYGAGECFVLKRLFFSKKYFFVFCFLFLLSLP